MKTGMIKRNRHRPNNRLRSSGPNSLDRNFEKDIDHDERLDYRPSRNRVVLQQNIDKYLNLAREAISTGDRVQAENYLQHADHFNRLLNEQKEIKQQFDQKRMQAMNAQSVTKDQIDENIDESAENAGNSLLEKEQQAIKSEEVAVES